MYNEKCLGGLNLFHLHSKDLALKCQWVSNTKSFPLIRDLSEEFLPTIKQDIWLCNLKPSDVSRVISDSFWKDVLYSWAFTHWHNPSNPSQIAAQTLWFNSHIRVQGKPVFYQAAHAAGILCVFNIWHSAHHRFLNYEELCFTYGDNCMSYLQYYGLILAIPMQWLTDLQQTRYILEDYVFSYELLQEKITTQMYNKLISDNTVLTEIKNKWQQILGINLAMEEFTEHFQRLYTLVPDTKHRHFQFKYLHRAIYGSNTLHRWGLVDSPYCQNCDTNELETIEHLFFTCTAVQRFWELFVSWYEATTDTEIEITLETVSFCNHENKLINTLIIIAKQFLFARRIAERPPNIYVFREKLALIIQMEHSHALKNRKCKLFVRKWRNLFPAVVE